MSAPSDPRPPNTGVTTPCPRCGVELQERSAGRAKLSACRQCGGVWLPQDAARVIVDHVQGSLPIVVASEKAARAARAEAPSGRTARCPWDAEPLGLVEIEGVTVDVCPVHGTWFDAGEVRRIANAHTENVASVAAAPRAWSSSSSSSSSRESGDFLTTFVDCLIEAIDESNRRS